MSDEERTNRGDNSERVTAGNQQREKGGRDTVVRSSEKKTRRSKLDHVDELFVDPAEIPDGFTVEWKRYSTMGKVDNEWMLGLERDGWEPAQPKDFPSRVSKNYTGNVVTHKDLILMIRPKELTQEAQQEERLNATGQVKSKFEELGLSKAGEAPRVDGNGRSMVKINKSYEKIPVS